MAWCYVSRKISRCSFLAAFEQFFAPFETEDRDSEFPEIMYLSLWERSTKTVWPVSTQWLYWVKWSYLQVWSVQLCHHKACTFDLSSISQVWPYWANSIFHDMWWLHYISAIRYVPVGTQGENVSTELLNLTFTCSCYFLTNVDRNCTGAQSSIRWDSVNYICMGIPAIRSR